MARTWKAEAIARGRDAGADAAQWWIQENGGGRDTRDSREIATAARKILAGMDEGDPAIQDTLPMPDLSGQWADTTNSTTLVEDITGVDHADWTERIENAVSDLCDAYETAFHHAAEKAIRRHLNGLLSTERGL